MRKLTTYQLWHGRDEAPARFRELRAGPLTVQLDGVELRYARLGGVEVVRRLHAAIRDHNWGTVPATISQVELEEGEGTFRLRFQAGHERDELAFCWRGVIVGGADGSLEYRLDGEAGREFPYNRIGLCVLHPVAETAGHRFRARTPQGRLDGRMPELIAPQRIQGGLPTPFLPSFQELGVEAADGVWAWFELEGDLFEIEDQRNWTDASFKTYSTPLSLGFPHTAEPGQRIRQRIRLTLRDASGAPLPVDRLRQLGEAGRAAATGGSRRRAPVRVTVAAEPAGPPPRVGLSRASHGQPLSGHQAALLRDLRLAHLRADLDLGGDVAEALEDAVAESRAVGAPLELALHLNGDDPAPGLDRLAADLCELRAAVARVLVFQRGEAVTPAHRVRLARERLRPALGGVPVCGGTDVLFTDLNRNRPEELDALDGVAYPLVATMHAADDTSVLETGATHGETVRTARSFSGALPVSVTPLTFNLRFNPLATGPERERGPDELPLQVDARQPSLLAAAWLVASLHSLAEAGAASVTYFETTGWRGVVERETGAPAAGRFASYPGMIFPAYHVLQRIGDRAGRDPRVLPVTSSDPLAVEALAVRDSEGVDLLLANLTPEAAVCEVGGLPDAPAEVYALDGESARLAADDPLALRDRTVRVETTGGGLRLGLAPFAVAAARVHT